MKTINGLSTLAFVAMSLIGSYRAEASETYRFRVTVQNGTAGNGLSPFLAVALKSGNALFSVGAPASAGLALVAETGNTSTLENELNGDAAVLDVSKASGGPTGPGKTSTTEIEVSASQVKKGATLNLVAMIGKSNDSFISVRGLNLFEVVSRGKVKLNALNYDAGSEENTGNVGDFGPGGHPTAGAEGLISYDRGLNPRGDAPEIIGWGSVAGVVTVECL